MSRKRSRLAAGAENDDSPHAEGSPEASYEAKRAEALRNMEALSEARRQALVQLRKIHVLFANLNRKQRAFINTNCVVGNYTPEQIPAVPGSPASVGFPEFDGVLRSAVEPLWQNVPGQLPLKKEAAPPGGTLQGQNLRFFSGIQQIQTRRKNILQFGIIQARAEELINAIAASAAVFNRQYKAASRELFPLGFISRLQRRLRRFFSGPYFFWREMGCLLNLGMAACFVLKIAEAPVLGER